MTGPSPAPGATGATSGSATSAHGLERSRRLVLGEVLARNARRQPDKPAIVFEDESLTYSELDSRVNRLAHGLQSLGVAAGDRVAVLMYNRLELVESLFACHKLGACPVPVNFRLSPDEVAYVLRHSGSRAVITDEQLLPVALDAGAGGRPMVVTGGASTPHGTSSYDALVAAGSDHEPDVLVGEDDLAFLMYTSGTTGLPKGAMLTHKNLVTNTMNWVTELQATGEDVWLSGLPLFHIGGINGLLPFLYLGGTSVITPSTGFDPLRSMRLIAEHQATYCYFVPTQWQQICALDEIAEIDTSHLRIALWGASQAPPSTLEQLVRTFPSVGVVNAFGMTEMSSNTCFLKPADAVRKMGSIGRPVLNVEVRVVDEQMRDVPRGTVGEIVYRGPTVMAGYFDDEAATAAAFEGGWFHSGDLVREDEDGFLYVVDRAKDMIISGGENIYPAEVERAVEAHPGVREVAVVGVPHPRWIETPIAVVVSAGDTDPTADEVLDFVKGKLASYKKPAAVLVVDSLPRNASGKILKRELRERYLGLFGDGGTQ